MFDVLRDDWSCFGVPDALLPPEKIRHVFAQVSNIVPSMDFGVESSHEDDSDDREVEPFEQQGVESALNQRKSPRAPSLHTVPEERKAATPKNIFKDSFRQSEGSSGPRSLEFDTLMTRSGHNIPSNILNDTFDFESLHRRDARTNPSRRARPGGESTDATHSVATYSIGTGESFGRESPKVVASPQMEPENAQNEGGMLSSVMGRLQEEEFRSTPSASVRVPL